MKSKTLVFSDKHCLCQQPNAGLATLGPSFLCSKITDPGTQGLRRALGPSPTVSHGEAVTSQSSSRTTWVLVAHHLDRAREAGLLESSVPTTRSSSV